MTRTSSDSAFGVGADHVGELRGQLDHVDGVAAPGQGQRVASGSRADIEHPMRRGIGRFVGQRPHTGVGFGTEQRRFAGGDPILVGALDRPPLGFDVVVQDRADRSVERDDDIRTRRGGVGLCQLALQRRLGISKLFGRKPSAYSGKNVVTHRHVFVDHARNGGQRDLPADRRSAIQPPRHGFPQQRRIARYQGRIVHQVPFTRPSPLSLGF